VSFAPPELCAGGHSSRAFQFDLSGVRTSLFRSAPPAFFSRPGPPSAARPARAGARSLRERPVP